MKYTPGSILIKNGRLIDPFNQVDRTADLYVENGTVVEIGTIDRPADTVIDAKDKIVSPGLIDTHVHFRQPGDEEEETILSGSTAAVAGGFTSVVCMPNTNPPIDEATAVEFVHRMGRQARKTFIYVMGAITKDRKGEELAEMGLMREAGAIGFTDDGAGVQNASIMLRAMKYVSMFNGVIAQHCQDESLAKNGVMNSGYYSTILGLPGMDPLAEEMMLWRDVQLLKKTKSVHYHAQHISTIGAVKIIREAKQEGLSISCEVTPHHLLLKDEMIVDYDTNYKVNPPIRSTSDIDALKEAIREGLVDCLATDHAPHLRSEKELEFLTAPFGIASIECALPLYIKALIETDVVGWSDMLAMLTWRPAKAMKIPRGTLAVGDRADITVIDPDLQWTIDVEKFYSKSHNCPYHGWTVRGKAITTIVAGEVRYSAETE